MSDKAYLILADGTVFEGRSCGASGTAVGELIFDTSMSGYQEALSDPTFAGQIVMMTYPLIGNCGVNDEDNESDENYLHALVVKELVSYPNNFRMSGNLLDYLKEKNIIAIEGVDTRAITKKLRDEGVMNAVVSTEYKTFDEVKDIISSYKLPDVLLKASTKEIFKVEGDSLSVGLIDYGQKKSFIESLTSRGVSVTVYPASTPADVILDAKHDGLFLSSGAGDPLAFTFQIETIKKLCQAKIPTFAVSLGHQILALANNMTTYKLTYGHHGANHPVKDLAKDKTYITAQNHGYAVCEKSVDASICAVSHTNLNDGTVEGITYKNAPFFSVQFLPEGAPGPKETAYLFDEFIAMMGGKKNA